MAKVTKKTKKESTPKGKEPKVVPESETEVEQKPEPYSFVKEFKAFITRGNVVELAVGLTVGAAFTKVVNSFVTNFLMPIIGLLLKGETFSQFYVSLDGKHYETLQAAVEAKAPILKYGQLVSDLLDFVIIALAVFVAIKVVTKLKLGEMPVKK